MEKTALNKKQRMWIRIGIVTAFAIAAACMKSQNSSSTQAEPVVSGSPVAETGSAIEVFNGEDLAGWVGDEELFKVEEGMIVSRSGPDGLDHNEFLFTENEYGDFYFAVDVKLVPNTGNSGIQFRSTRAEDGHAMGYQADIGQGLWGELYHEGGRGLLAEPTAGEEAAKPEEWNRYEILAVGPHVWTAVNGVLSTAIDDPAGELSGRIALQMHSGPPQEVLWKNFELVVDPPVELADMSQEELEAALVKPNDSE